MRSHVPLLFAGLALASGPAAAQPTPEGAAAAGRQVTMGLLFYNACASSYPEMAARHARGYRAWRGRHSLMISTLENEPGVKAAINEAVARAKENATRDKGGGAKGQCEDFMKATFVDPAAPPPPPRPPVEEPAKDPAK
jgi:hypothetical protein